MSYCRWSSMNWMCDVYVYESAGDQWITHVAGRRRVFPPIPDITGWKLSLALHRWSGAGLDKTTKKFIYTHPRRAIIYKIWTRFAAFWHRRIHMFSLHLIPFRPIGMEYDGETFTSDTAEDCADLLESLMDIGYNVPQYAIDALREESLSEEQR